MVENRLTTAVQPTAVEDAAFFPAPEQGYARRRSANVAVRAAEILQGHPQFIVPAFFAAALLLTSTLHSTFWEWGGVMQAFEGKEIVTGHGIHGWASHFWPPLFALLTGLGSLMEPAFNVGKQIGICSAVLLLIVAFKFSVLLYGSRRIALLAQLFIGLNPLFFYESFQAHNHMLDALLFVTGLYIFVKEIKAGPRPRALLLAGVICGLAALTRYQSFILLTLAPIMFVLFDRRKAMTASALFLAGFVGISFPWWVYNGIVNGSPFNTWEHLNLGAVLFPGNRAEWWWSEQSAFHGTLSLIRAYPGSYIRNFVYNLGYFGKAFLYYLGAISLFVVPGIFESLTELDSKSIITLYGVWLFLILLVSQVFLPNYELLSSIVLFTIVGVSFCLSHATRMTQRYHILGRIRYDLTLPAILLILSGALTFQKSYEALRDSSAAGVLPEVDTVAAVLRQHDPGIAGKVIMAIDPGVAYHVGSEYLETPGYYRGTLEEMVGYRGLTEEVKKYAAKYPSDLPLSGLHADYLFYTRVFSDPRSPFPEVEPGQFSFLFDAGSPRIPGNFHLVYKSEKVVVYEVLWGQNSGGTN